MYICLVKKSVAALLIFIYTLSIIGLAVNKFYCCGKLESVSFFANPKHLNAEKQSKAEGCCKNEKQSFKVKDSHVSSDKIELNAKLFALVPPVFSYSELLIFSLVNKQLAYHIKAPPVYSGTPAYIFNCTYRI